MTNNMITGIEPASGLNPPASSSRGYSTSIICTVSECIVIRFHTGRAVHEGIISAITAAGRQMPYRILAAILLGRIVFQRQTNIFTLQR